VRIVGIDAIGEFLDAINRGAALASWAHHGAWIGAFSTVRVFDALAGVKLVPPERMMFFGGFIVDTPDAAAEYQKLMYGDTLPFNYELMSRALHPNDWDPQNSMTPMDIEQYWERDPKPSGYQLPAAYVTAKSDGTFEQVAEQYKSAFKSDPFASVRSKCANGGQDVVR
jgi:ribose transport system substrate-binding protein